MSKCKHIGEITPGGATRVTTSCGGEYFVDSAVNLDKERDVIYCAFCGKVIKLKIKKAQVTKHHHDDATGCGVPEAYEALAVAFDELEAKLKETVVLIDASTEIPYQVQDALRHFANDIGDFANLVGAWKPRWWDPITGPSTKAELSKGVK